MAHSLVSLVTIGLQMNGQGCSEGTRSPATLENTSIARVAVADINPLDLSHGHVAEQSLVWRDERPVPNGRMPVGIDLGKPTIHKLRRNMDVATRRRAGKAASAREARDPYSPLCCGRVD